jgi:hypothetical protein
MFIGLVLLSMQRNAVSSPLSWVAGIVVSLSLSVEVVVRPGNRAIVAAVCSTGYEHGSRRTGPPDQKNFRHCPKWRDRFSAATDRRGHDGTSADAAHVRTAVTGL